MGSLHHTYLPAALLLFLAGIPAHATPTDFVFDGFDASSNISLAGIATLNSRIIQLTNASHRVLGRALYPVPVQIKSASTNLTSSFSTTFVFSIHPLYPTIGGHGMAFLMTPSLDSAGAFPIQYLGLLNATNNGKSSNHLFAVEFDTDQNVEFQDIDDNHVGIDLNSLTSVSSAPASYWTRRSSGKVDVNLRGAQNIQAWIQYNGLQQQLNVSISVAGQPQPASPLLSVHLDLSTVLEDYMYVGFSGSTGAISESHYVLAWSFNSNGVARSLDLSKLPSIHTASSSPSRGLIVSVCIAAIVLLLLVMSVAIYWSKRRRREPLEDWELEYGLHRYSYKDLSIATNRFHDKQMLGEGGFGRVYRGVLPGTGLQLAVKRLSHRSDQGEREFIAEMSSIGRMRHRNLVQLRGWSRSRRRGELLLVYDYMPNGSLDKMLFGESTFLLRWTHRYKILSGVAAGVLYLHEEWEQQVLHRDVKASNVLLDGELNGKLGDFGLARLYEHGKNPHTTRAVGTLGYLAPEFSRTGKATTSTDVFSFGALLLEVACGRRPLDPRKSAEEFILVDWVWRLHTQGRLLEAADPRLAGDFVTEEMERVLLLGLLCSQPNPTARPTMRQVVQILAADATLPPLPSLVPTLDGTAPPYLEAVSYTSWSTATVSTNVSAR